MPIEKQQNGKPFTPALSSNFRGTKSPLTPRLAGPAPNSPASAQRRDVFARTRSPVREETAPAATINLNITPRSAARKSRIGTESPATPASNRDANVSRPRTKSNAAPRTSPPASAGLGISSPAAATSSRTNQVQNPVKSPTPVYMVPRRTSGARSAVQNDDGGDSKFFRADAAKSYASLPGVNDKVSASPTDNQFFYAGSVQPEIVASPKLSSSKEANANIVEKFFHASDIRAQSAPRSSPHVGTQVRSPVISTASPQSHSNDRNRPGTSASRGSSPHKPPPRLLQNAHASQPTSPQKATLGGKVYPSATPNSNVVRRTSVGSHVSGNRPDMENGHKKSVSTSSISGTPPRKPSMSRQPMAPAMNAALKTSLHEPVSSIDRQHFPPLSETISPRSTSLASSNTAATSLTSDVERPEAQKFPSSNSLNSAIASISSPTLDPWISKSTDPPRPVNDGASNARRERKVLDLEISNSSLLAINKTLERELRKQSVELRRFRRLSRSGRLSIAPTERTVSGSTLDIVAELNDEEDSGSEPEDESDLDGLDEEDILSNDSSSIQSPTSKARQRARDEKRLMLDLSKHQQMLLDSQKLTQSIRRCLTCTEELIQDGNKAIEYRVGIGDVKLGGRVLTNEDLDQRLLDDGDDGRPQRQGLLSPSITSADLTEANLWIENTKTSSPEPEAEEQVLSPGVERLFAELLEE